MEQKVSPATRPREISSRSSRDSRNAEGTRGRGAKPPARFTSQRIAQVDRLRRREIDRSDSPAATARQISVFSSSLSRVYNAPPPVEQGLACSPSECVDP